MKNHSLFGGLMELVRIYWWAALLIAAGFLFAYSKVAPPPPREITVATGSESGGYHRFGQQLKAALEKKGLKVNLQATGGTIDNLKLLNDPASKVTVAFAQGGADQFYDGDKEDIRALGSLFYEPLWIFYRKECNLTNFGEVKHLKVAIGRNGSGTQNLSKVLLRENNIPETNWVAVGSSEAVEAIAKNEVQALFLVAPVNDPMDKRKPHPDVYKLMANPELSLFPAKRAQAYVSRLPHLSVVSIGEGLLDLDKNYPPTTINLVSPLGTLVCREDLNGDIAMLILQTVRELQADGGWLEKSGEFPSRHGVTFPLLPEAKQFFDKGPSFLYRLGLPFWVANLINRLWIMAIPLLTLAIPSIKLALPTYRWRIRRKIATKYRVLMAIDHKITTGSIRQSLDADIARLMQYEDELARLSVPIMFAGDFYTLRGHVRYLRQRLEELKQSGNLKA
jgi:TRAP-type uncharacterized transport system substrate-binding protein